MFGSAKLVLILAAVAAILFGAERLIHSHDASVKAGVDAGYQAQAAAAQDQAASESARRQAAQGEANDEAYRLTNKARDAAVRAATASAGLRSDARTFGRGLAVNPGASGPSAADRLADVLGECSLRYSEVAAVADRAIIAGQLCERDYDALTASP